jgi:hypothetical protein
MRREQRRQSRWASADNSYTCATKTQSHLLRRGPNWQAYAIKIFGGIG